MVAFACLRLQLYQYVTAPFSVSDAPSTNALMTVSLSRERLERVMGIEPTLAAWEAAVLPLNYTRAG